MEQMMRSAQAGRIVHALLFCGPHGTGKKSMARVLARAALCMGEGEKPCDACPACKRFLNDSHPDVHYLAPEKNTIKVDQIRELIEKLNLASYEGGKKIAIIDRADSMNESAQNALLKTLENPTGDTLFFLLTDTPGALLPTIVSRCLQLRFRCLEAGECEGVLRGHNIDADRARLLAAIAQGSVGRALEIHADDEYLDLRSRVIDALESMKKPEDVARAAAKIGTDKGREKAVLEILELWARDLMRVQNGAQPCQADEMQRLQKSKYGGSMRLQRVMLARRQLAANLSWANVLETMFFALVTGKG